MVLFTYLVSCAFGFGEGLGECPEARTDKAESQQMPENGHRKGVCPVKLQKMHTEAVFILFHLI